MKIKDIIILAAAGSLALSACKKEMTTDSFEDIKVSSSFVTFSAEGGSKTVVITATQDWKFIVDATFPDVITFNKNVSAKYDYYGNLTNAEEDIKSRTASWASVSAIEGKAGETNVTFTAGASAVGRELTVAILCGTDKQYIQLRQGDLSPVVMTCKQIKEEANVGASYIVEGTVTKLGNYASYGAFYVNDGTYPDSDVQIYGSTKASRESYPNVEVGDYVKFKGTWSSYKNFENVEILKHVKSLLKVTSEPVEVKSEGERIVVKVAYKGDNFKYSVPEEFEDWIAVTGIDVKEGIPTKLETNPADTAYVSVKVGVNEGVSARAGSLSFSSSKTEGGKTSESAATYSFSQAGLLPVGQDMLVIEDDKFTASYPADESEFKAGDFDFLYYLIANYGSGIQFKKTDSYIANKTALGKKIVSIEVIGHSSKSWYPTNVTLYAGTEAKPSTNAITPVSDPDNKKLTYDLSGGAYTFFSLNNTSNYAVYLESVSIIYEK